MITYKHRTSTSTRITFGTILYLHFVTMYLCLRIIAGQMFLRCKNIIQILTKIFVEFFRRHILVVCSYTRNLYLIFAYWEYMCRDYSEAQIYYYIQFCCLKRRQAPIFSSALPLNVPSPNSTRMAKGVTVDSIRQWPVVAPGGHPKEFPQ